jgi:NADPH:quinone reductase
MNSLTARALAGAAAGAIHPAIGQRVPLVRAAQAHRAIEDRATIGKTLLIPPGRLEAPDSGITSPSTR